MGIHCLQAGHWPIMLVEKKHIVSIGRDSMRLKSNIAVVCNMLLLSSLTACSRYVSAEPECLCKVTYERTVGVVDNRYQSLCTINTVTINGHEIVLSEKATSAEKSFFIHTKDYGPMKIEVLNSNGAMVLSLLMTREQKEQIRKLGVAAEGTVAGGVAGGITPGTKVEGSTLGGKATIEEPLRIGGEVQAPIEVFRVQPQYPEEARKARVKGFVILETTITKEGTVESAHVVHGDPRLNDAVIKAVLQWKYKAATVNGRPVRVYLTVTVPFNLQ